MINICEEAEQIYETLSSFLAYYLGLKITVLAYLKEDVQ